jgi:hypothetical protein
MFGTPPLLAKEEPVESRRWTELGSEAGRLAQDEAEPQGALLFPEQTDLITHRQKVFAHWGVGQVSRSTPGSRCCTCSWSTRIVSLGAQDLSEVLWVGMSHMHLPHLFDDPYRQTLPLAHQGITDMGGQQGLEPMVRLTTDHHRTTMARVCRFENVQDDILSIDRVYNLRLHGIRRHVCRMENLLRAREHGFSRLRRGLAPAGLFCMEVHLFSLFLLRIPRAAEFQEFAGQ